MDVGEKRSEDSPVVEEPEDDENADVNEEEEDDDNDEDDEDDGHDYDEEDDDQNSIAFERKATLLTRASKESQWETVALGNLIIYYDSSIFGEKIILKADKTDEIVSNTIISMDTKMEVKDINIIIVIVHGDLVKTDLINAKKLFY